MRGGLTGSLGLLALFLAGCSTNPPNYYVFSSLEQPRATVRHSKSKDLTMCMNGQHFTMRQPSTSADPTLYEVPAGAPITVRAYLRYSKGGITSICVPRMTFVPAAGQLYEFDYDWADSDTCIGIIKTVPDGKNPPPPLVRAEDSMC